jgi:predicted nucleic acid-binding Zn ribbon protein
VHFKGSGFYSTDYGKGGGRKPSRDGDSSSEKTEKGEQKEKKDKDKDVKKVAET